MSIMIYSKVVLSVMTILLAVAALAATKNRDLNRGCTINGMPVGYYQCSTVGSSHLMQVIIPCNVFTCTNLGRALFQSTLF